MVDLAVKTNERPGTRAVLRNSHMSAYKAREVLNLIRNLPVGEALEVLRLCGRDAAIPIAKLLASCVANAENNDALNPDELYVSTAYADESTTIKRWRPRARGRATRIRKRTCHVTLIVSRLPEDQILQISAKKQAVAAERRARRVAGSKKSTSKTDSSPSASDEVVTDVDQSTFIEPESRDLSESNRDTDPAEMAQGEPSEQQVESQDDSTIDFGQDQGDQSESPEDEGKGDEA